MAAPSDFDRLIKTFGPIFADQGAGLLAGVDRAEIVNNQEIQKKVIEFLEHICAKSDEYYADSVPSLVEHYIHDPDNEYSNVGTELCATLSAIIRDVINRIDREHSKRNLVDRIWDECLVEAASYLPDEYYINNLDQRLAYLNVALDYFDLCYGRGKNVMGLAINPHDQLPLRKRAAKALAEHPEKYLTPEAKKRFSDRETGELPPAPYRSDILKHPDFAEDTIQTL